MRSSEFNLMNLEQNEIDFTTTKQKSMISYEWARRISTGTLSIDCNDSIPTCFVHRISIENLHKTSSCQIHWVPQRKIPDWRNQLKFGPPIKAEDGLLHDCAFSIEPKQLRVAARSKAEFVVHFRPVRISFKNESLHKTANYIKLCLLLKRSSSTKHARTD